MFKIMDDLNFTNNITFNADNSSETFWSSQSTDATKEMPFYQFDPNGAIRIPLYSIIFVCGLIGNSLVIATLVKNRRLRIVTNIFLFNLAVSDLLLGVLCMPITLIGALLREFIFGEIMCKIIPYFQGVSVAVNAWTLVAISLERYFAVCEPLKSRRWQTPCHAYKIISMIWLFALLLMMPIAWLNRLYPMKSKKYKCRENWPDINMEGAFNICLDVLLLVLPLILMGIVYGRIASVLRQGIKDSQKCALTIAIARTSASGYYNCVNGSLQDCLSGEPPKLVIKWNKYPILTDSTELTSSSDKYGNWSCGNNADIRSSNIQHRLAVKNRVIRMLFVVVLEYFICWTPIYVINTIYTYRASDVYDTLGNFGVSFFHLISYTSSCCNPLTYCFVNKNFRKEFLQTFRRSCRHSKQTRGRRGFTETSMNGNVVHPCRSNPIETLVLSSKHI